MKNLLAIGMILLGVSICTINVASASITPVKEYINKPASNNYNNYNNVYNRDLNRVENYLFGTTYSRENTASRLNRIEKRLFSQNYGSMNLAQRMNNVLANYRRDDYNNRNYLADYYNNATPAQRIINRFTGQPTGFTPPIMNTPFGSGSFRPGYSQGYYGNRGYGYHNSIPAMTGAGIRILD